MRLIEAYRELTLNEREIVDRLLEPHFQGRDEIAEQIRSGKVRRADSDGCLEFYVESEVKARVLQRVPTEAEAEDEDGVVIHALLHVVDGKVKELEFHKEAPLPIKRMPKASEWRVVTFPPPKP